MIFDIKHRKKVVFLLFGLTVFTGCVATIQGVKSDISKAGKSAGIFNRGASEKLEEQSLSTAHSRISDIQTKLKNLGYYNGEVDGEFSAQTEAAIQDFQLDNGLRIDGRPTQELHEVLAVHQ